MYIEPGRKSELVGAHSQWAVIARLAAGIVDQIVLHDRTATESIVLRMHTQMAGG